MFTYNFFSPIKFSFLIKKKKKLRILNKYYFLCFDHQDKGGFNKFDRSRPNFQIIDLDKEEEEMKKQASETENERVKSNLNQPISERIESDKPDLNVKELPNPNSYPPSPINKENVSDDDQSAFDTNPDDFGQLGPMLM